MRVPDPLPVSFPRRWPPAQRQRFGAAVMCVMLLAGLAMAPQASAQTSIAGNPSCTALGYAFGFKPQPEPPPTGTYNFPDGLHTVSIVSNGVMFDWDTDTFGMDAVIVKGGPNANLYGYDPEATSDEGLHAPINAGTGNPYGISHIEFCYDYELNISKDASTQWDRNITWEIDKTVDPSEFHLFLGESGLANYEVTVNKTVDESASLTGNIYIANDTPYNANVLTVTDDFEGEALAVECPGGLPQALAPGASLVCTYSKAYTFPGPDPVDGTNTVTVTASGVGGGTATAPVDFSLTVIGFETIEVNDTNGSSWSTSDDETWTYPQEFTCSSDFSDYTDGVYTFGHPNTATIQETGQSSDAEVNVYCYAPTLSKDAITSYNRTWSWTIDKAADQTDLLLSDGQLFTVNYTVEVAASPDDHDISISGTITVWNPHPTDVMVVSLADALSGGTPVTLCNDALAFNVPPGGSHTCAYTAWPETIEDQTNTASVTINGATDTFSAAATFGDPADETDECAEVSDTFAGALGTVCAGDAPQTFMYALLFGRHPDADVYLECEENTSTNVASFLANDSGATGEDSWTVNATVACEVGCTLTPGYWKTHSENGPAPYDDTWAMLPNGADTPFFLSLQTYYEVLWTAPAGNAYYSLSFHYIAAELNMLNDASVPVEVQAAFDAATALFNTYTPAQVAAFKGKTGTETRAQFITLAGILGSYNEGDIGPGHCSEEEEATESVSAQTAASAAAELPGTELTAEISEGEATLTPEEAPRTATAEEIPTEYGLETGYPNPFRSSTTLTVRLPESAHVTLMVYDLLGRAVTVLVDEAKPAGTHRIVWDGAEASNGTYLIVLRAGDFTASRGLTLMR